MAHHVNEMGDSEPSLIDPPSVTEIRELLLRRLPGDHPCTVEGPIRLHAASAIHRATCPGIPHAVLLKRPHVDDNSARAQHEALCRAARRVNPLTGLRVPVSYPYLVDDGFVMVELVNAPDLHQFIHNPMSRLAAVVSKLERVGAWLAAYHREDQQHIGSVQVDELLDNVRAKAWNGAAGPHRPNLFRQYFDVLQKTADVVGRELVTIAVGHGDYKPRNILIDRDEIVGVDIPEVGPIPVVHDLAHFLLHLDMVLLYPAAWRLWYWRSPLRAAFLRGYRQCSPGVIVDARSLAWAELQRVIDLYYARRDLAKGPARRHLVAAAYLICAHLRAQDLRRAFRASPALRVPITLPQA